jgi:group I intron endonuclease
MMCGVYIITCVLANKVYIGSSVSIAARWKTHRSALNRNCHGNPYLQAAWNKYGADAFRFETVELTRSESRVEREGYWIAVYRAAERDHGYNIHAVPSMPQVVSDETRARQSAAKKTPEAIARLVVRNKQQVWTPEMRAKVARSHTPEMRKRIADALRGGQLSPEHRMKLSRSLVGRPVSGETRARIGRANARKSFVVTSPDGVEHFTTNLSQFCRERGLSVSNLCHVAKGKRPHHRGWTCRYE